MNLSASESLFLRMPQGLCSRIRLSVYRLLGLKAGKRNRMERSRCRRLSQIEIGKNNAFTEGVMLWPEDKSFEGIRIRIGDNNYFNRNTMIDSCGYIQIGDGNMFGPDIYITDSNHSFANGVSPHALPMLRGKVIIGNNCWIGAKAIILKDVELGDNSVVAAGAVVTKSFPAGSVIGGVPAKLMRQL